MKNLSEYIIESKIENYLLDDLITSINCRLSCNPFRYFNEIHESLGNFLNCKNVVNEISDWLLKNINELDIENIKDKTINIDVSKCDTWCKNVEIILNGTTEKYSGGTLYADKNGNVKIHLELNKYFKIEIDDIEGMILHELIHGYEEYNRKLNDKVSLFSELSDEYYNAKDKIKRRSEDIQNLAVMKYFFNPKERNANFGALEKDIKNLIDKLDPKRERINLNNIRKELKESEVWKRYFDFEKFLLDINKYSDKSLESAYYDAVTDEDKAKQDLENHINKIKSGESDKDFKKIKSAKEIRKEAENVWNIFNRKFNQLFSKIYCKHILVK